MVLGATLEIGGLKGERLVRAEEFFKGLFETDLRPGELILGVRFPIQQKGTAVGFAGWRAATATSRSLASPSRTTTYSAIASVTLG